MAVNLDAVRCLKMESPSGGGRQLDTYPTELDPLQDAVTAAGVYLQNASDTVTDKNVLVDRANTDLRLTDVATTRLLKELVTSVTGQVGSHNALLDSIHYMGDAGPADGHPSGSVCQITRNGPLVTSRVWYTNNSLTSKIFSTAYSYTGPLCTTITRILYGPNNAVVRTLTDALQYTGPLCTGRTRTWS